MRLILVRHGEPDYEKDCLTPRGIEQAKAAALRLKDEGISRIFTSSMGRARETAAFTSELLGIKDVTVLDFMRELCWGSTDGYPVFADGHPWAVADELVRRGTDLLDKDWGSHEFYRRNKVLANCRRTGDLCDEWLGTLGYRRDGLYYRNVREDDKPFTAALFCHGGSSSVLIARVLNLTFPYVCATCHADFTGITVLRFDRHPGELTVPVLELACDSRHILNLRPPR